MGYDKLCRPKNEGDIGMRDLEYIIKASILKQAWKFLAGNTQWAVWTKAKYLKVENFWSINADNNSSCICKNIIKHRDILSQSVERQVERIEHTSIWFDPRLQGDNFINLYGWDTYSTYGSRDHVVSKITVNGKWNTSKLPEANCIKKKLEYIPIFVLAGLICKDRGLQLV